MRKYLLLAAALFIGLPLLAFAALYLFVDPQKYTPLLTAKLSESLARATTVEKLELQLFPPGFLATNLTVADDPSFSKSHFLTTKSLEVRPELLPLLSGQLEIASLRLEQPEVELIQRADGVWNYESLGGNKKSSDSKPLKLARLIIDDAKLGLTRAGSTRDQYSDI
ncbi:MAG: AsmA family protein, partial [Chloroflexia bacterium]